MGKTRFLFLGIVVLGVLGSLAALLSFEQVAEIALLFTVVAVALMVFIIHRYLVKSRVYSNKQFDKLNSKIDDFEVTLGDSSAGGHHAHQGSLLTSTNNGVQIDEKSIKAPELATRTPGGPSKLNLNSRSFSSEKAFALYMKGNARNIERFALNSKSSAIRNSIALTASNGECNYAEIRSNVDAFLAENEGAESLIKQWNMRWLLLLARVLSNQRFSQNDIEYSARIFEAVTIIFGAENLGERDRLLFAEVLQDCGAFESAIELLKDADVDSTDPAQLGLVIANKARTQGDFPESWLRLVNSIYKRGDLAPITFAPEQAATPLDSLSCGEKLGRIEGPLVSVLIPTYNGAPRIRTALTSLNSQTWSQIEIIVIDDGSSAANNEVLRSVCAEFSNVTLLEQGENLGAYEARNRGLNSAKGEFITVHDDDDWSHPQKIALQVQHLLEHPEFAANTTKHVRVTEELEFTRINSNPTYVQNNFSSLMFRKSIVGKIGNWDIANRGADEEFKNRLTKIGGFEIAAIGEFPMSFTRTHSKSLTAGELFRGFQDPARLMYFAGYKLAHKQVPRGKMVDKSSFVRPLSMKPGYRGKHFGAFDTVYVGDFTSLNPQLVRAIYESEVLAGGGKRIGFLYMHSPFNDKNPGVTEELLIATNKSGFELLTLGDKAQVETLVVIDPAVFVFAENLVSSLEVVEAVVQVESEAARGGVNPTIALDRSVSNLRKMFSIEPTVFFMNEAKTNEHLRRTYHSVNYSDAPWASIRSLSVTQAKSADPERLPTIGRHSAYSKTPWPELLSDIKLVYVQPDTARTKVYEDLSDLSQKAQELITHNSEIISASSVQLTDYLDSLDFWIFQNSSRKVTAVPAGVYEALCRGLVVILPPEFEPIFGSAALYSKPKQVAGLVKRVWETKVLYDEQSKRAIEFANRLVTVNSK